MRQSNSMRFWMQMTGLMLAIAGASGGIASQVFQSRAEASEAHHLHAEVAGHPVTLARMKRLESDIVSLSSEIKEHRLMLIRIEIMVANIADKLKVRTE